MDILVGKVTRGRDPALPEENSSARFSATRRGREGSSLRVPPGIEGIVIDAKVLHRKRREKDDPGPDARGAEARPASFGQEDEIRQSWKAAGRLKRSSSGKKTSAVRLSWRTERVLLAKKKKITKRSWRRSEERWAGRGGGGWRGLKDRLSDMYRWAQARSAWSRRLFTEDFPVRRGDGLPPGSSRWFKVYIAMKRKLSVGDKMAGPPRKQGRHLPDLQRGHAVHRRRHPGGHRPEPVGVPSRMNVGQIMEAHLMGRPRPRRAGSSE